jgi:hypothetical protein
MIYQIIGITRYIQQKLLCCLLDYLVYLFKQQNQALAQQSIQTIKYRNLVIDLSNEPKANAQLRIN